MSARWIAATLVHDTPDLAARMREQLPDVLVIDNGSTVPIEGAAMRFDDNLGFVRGWNEAMRQIIGERPDIDCVWMLNSDVEGVTPTMGDELFALHDVHYDVAGVTPAFNSPHAMFNRQNTDDIRSVKWLDWTCPMISVYDWIVTGDFDEQSTGYFADVDWCKRVRDEQAALFVSDAHEVNHLGSITAQRIGHTWSADDTWLCKKWGVNSWTELT